MFAYPELDKFWEEVQADPNRDFRNSFIFAIRQMGIDGTSSVQEAASVLTRVFNERGHGVTIPALRHLAYHAPDGSDLKQWAVNEVVRQSLDYAEDNPYKAQEELRKAACFAHDDEELDHAVVPQCMHIVRSRLNAAQQEGDKEYRRVLIKITKEMRDTAYLARPGSLLDNAAGQMFRTLMDDELKNIDMTKYFEIYVESLPYVFPDSALEYHMSNISVGGVAEIMKTDKARRNLVGGIFALAKQNRSYTPEIREALQEAVSASSENTLSSKTSLGDGHADILKLDVPRADHNPDDSDDLSGHQAKIVPFKPKP